VTTLTNEAIGHGTWNREGVILALASGGLARVPANGGPPKMMVKDPVRDGAPLTFLAEAESSGQVVQDRLFYVNQGSLFAHTLDLDRMELIGEPERIAEANGFSVSASGVIAYRSGRTALDRSQLRWWDRNGTPGDAVGEPGPQRAVALSPDGRRVAVDLTIQDNRDVWIVDLIRRATFMLNWRPKQK
jgi:hypothetical protein